MSFIYRFLTGIAFAGAGLFFLVKTKKFVDMVGVNNWAETHLGSGGTYILVKLLGLVAIVFGVLLVFGIVKLFS